MNYPSSNQVPFSNFGYAAFQTNTQDTRISPLGLGLGMGALSLGMGGGFVAPFAVGTLTGAALDGGFNNQGYYGNAYYGGGDYPQPYYYAPTYSQQGYNGYYGQQPVMYSSAPTYY